MKRRWRVGTRGSKLALAQTQIALSYFSRLSPARWEIKVIKTIGDLASQLPFTGFSQPGIFTTALEEALLAGEIDIAVHSLKDLPTKLAEGTLLAAILPRGEVSDAFLSREYASLLHLPPNSTVGTSSRRRQALIRHLRPDLTPVELRGNLTTRIEKTLAGRVAGAIVAYEGLRRLGYESLAREILPAWAYPTAAAQAAIGLQIRSQDEELKKLLQPVDHKPTRWAVETERTILLGLGGGCRMPLGIYAQVETNQVSISVGLYEPKFQLIRIVGSTENITHIIRETIQRCQPLL